MAFRAIALSVRFRRNFAFMSCALAALHFVLETAYTIFVGKFLGIADVLIVGRRLYAFETSTSDGHYMRCVGLYLLFALPNVGVAL